MADLEGPSRHSAYRRQHINRDHSRTLATIIPWGCVLMASVLPQLSLITGIPLWPPLGFVMLLAWRLARPGLFPVWAGFPLGMWDDLFSGQPFGSAILLWSLAMIALEFVEARFPWRGFLQDWLTGAAAVAIYLVAANILSGGQISVERLALIGPQLALSIILFPVAGRIVAILDRLRLLRIRTIG